MQAPVELGSPLRAEVNAGLEFPPHGLLSSGPCLQARKGSARPHADVVLGRDFDPETARRVADVVLGQGPGRGASLE